MKLFEVFLCKFAIQKKEPMINFNGAILPDTTTIFNSKNRAFNYGDALFETIKIQNLKVVFLEEHYFRLMASMRMLRMEIPMTFTLDFFEEELLKTVTENNFSTARIRITVFRENGGLYKPQSNKVNFLVEASQLNNSIKNKYSVDLFKDYYVYSGLLSTIKTTNKITNVLASIYASENNIDNCILLNESKRIVEAINGNIFLVFGSTIKTPLISEGCIKGIARKKVIEIISKNPNYTIEETEISPFELQKADEIFITNAIVGIQPVTSYRKRNFDNSIARLLIKDFNQLI